MNLNKIIAVVALLVGCSPTQHPISSNELSGSYHASYHDGEDTLLLFNDGTYEHSYFIDGKIITERKRWEILDAESSAVQVELRLFDFRFRSGKHTVLDKSDWIVNAEKSKRVNISTPDNSQSVVRLCFDYDLDHCFVRQGGVSD